MYKLLIIFSIFLFLFLPICYSFGELVLNKIKIKFNEYLTIFAGFISIIAVFQLMYYPAMILQLSSNYLIIFGIIFTLFLVILNFKKSGNIKKIYKNKYIWLIIIFTCITFFIYMRTMPHEYWYFDDTFYLNFIYENADTSKLLSIEPRSGGVISKINHIYSSQGYYMIGSYIVGLYNIFRNFLNLKYPYVSNIYYFMAFPSFLMLFISAIGLAKQIAKKTWKKVLFIALYIYSTVFLMIDSNLLNNMIMNGYIGVFIILTIFIPFIIYLLFEYINGKRKNAYFLSITFLTILSYASFNVFMIFVLLYALVSILFITKKKLYLNDFAVMVFPVALFLPCFIISNNIICFICELIILLLYFLYYKFNKKILSFEKEIFNIVKIFVLIFPVLTVIASMILILFKIPINSSTLGYLNNILNTMFPLFGTLSFHYSDIFITLFSFAFWIMFLYLLIIKKTKNNTTVLFITIILIAFLNPFEISFISTYLTSETFNRLYILIMNPVIYYYVFEILFDKINHLKIKKILLILFIILCVFIQLKESDYWVNVCGKSNKLYRMRDRDIVAAKRLELFVNDNGIDKVNIATTHSELKIIYPEMYSLLDRTLKYEPDETFTKRAYFISFLYDLNKGKITQEYLEKYSASPSDVFNYLNINFITIDLECPVLNEFNFEPNVLCIKPVKSSEMTEEKHKENIKEYEKDKKIYNEMLKSFELVYQTERYKLYYVKEGE